MGWRSRIPKTMTKAHLKTIVILQKHNVRYNVEKFFQLEPRGFVVADIYLPDKGVNGMRLECDGEFHGPKADKDAEKDERLMKQHGIPTIRLKNNQILRKDGEKYIMESIESEAS